MHLLAFKCWQHESQGTTQDLQETGASSGTPRAPTAVPSSVGMLLLFSRSVTTQLDVQELPEISKGQRVGGTTRPSHAAMGTDRLHLLVHPPSTSAPQTQGYPLPEKAHQCRGRSLISRGRSLISLGRSHFQMVTVFHSNTSVLRQQMHRYF